MITIRRADERGHFNHGWLNTYHTFSFADYHDPGHMGFRDLRVINEDRVQPGSGFGTHGHRDMEILSYVLEGGLEHRDSLGNGGVVRPGEVQRMSAGTGVRHSESNASKSDPLHFLQIWIQPSRAGLDPGYEQKMFGLEERKNHLRLIASPDGADGSLSINQDVRLYTTVLDRGQKAEHQLDPGRYGWLQVARGQVELNGQILRESDGAAVSNEGSITILGNGDSEILLFDLG